MMDQYVKLLFNLISESPVSEDCVAVRRAEERMREFLECNGVFCRMESVGSRKVLWAATAETRTVDVLFNAHLDVVPSSVEGQHVPRIEDGFLYGRGAADCLGNAVCVAKLLCSMVGRAEIGCIFTADEETGGATTSAMVERGYRAKRSVVVMDGGYGMVSCSQKGMLVLKLTARGGGGHSSDPWNYSNPIETLIAGFSRIRTQWRNPSAEDYWHDSMTPCVMQGGSVDNAIPKTATMLINIRYVEGGGDERILRMFRELPGIEVEVKRSSLPLEGDENHPEVKRFVASLRAEFGDAGVVVKPMCGATDARHLGRLGVPVVITGLNGSGAHGGNERLELASLDRCFRGISNYLVERR